MVVRLGDIDMAPFLTDHRRNFDFVVERIRIGRNHDRIAGADDGGRRFDERSRIDLVLVDRRTTAFHDVRLVVAGEQEDRRRILDCGFEGYIRFRGGWDLARGRSGFDLLRDLQPRTAQGQDLDHIRGQRFAQRGRAVGQIGDLAIDRKPGADSSTLPRIAHELHLRSFLVLQSGPIDSNTFSGGCRLVGCIDDPERGNQRVAIGAGLAIVIDCPKQIANQRRGHAAITR